MVCLRSARRLRGTPLDVFGRAEVRRLERSMVDEYCDAVRRLVAGWSSDRSDEAVAIASLPDRVRGYEDLKVRRATQYRAELAERLTGYER